MALPRAGAHAGWLRLTVASRAPWPRRCPPPLRLAATSATAAPSSWPAPPAPGSEVHLWWLDADATPARAVPPPSDEALPALATWLTLDERARAEDASSEASVRRERLLSRALVRGVLARYAGAAPGALCIARGAFGKPFLVGRGAEGDLDLRFSVAHARGALLLAVARGAECGADVERADRAPTRGVERVARSPRPTSRVQLRHVTAGVAQPPRPWAAQAARYFAAAEAEALAREAEGAERGRAFVAHWALKEAYVKALGRGIAGTPLRSFAVRMLQPLPAAAVVPVPAEVTVVDAGDAGEAHTAAPREAGGSPLAGAGCWQLASLPLPPEHIGAVCLQATAPTRVALRRARFETGGGTAACIEGALVGEWMLQLPRGGAPP